MGDTYFNPNPDDNPGDVFQSSVRGDIWFGTLYQWKEYTAWDILNTNEHATAWDILNAFAQDIAWDILNAGSEDTAWDILNDPATDTSWDIINLHSHDIAWDILNVFLQTTSWDTLNENNQDIAWSIFADTLFFLQQLYIKQICFDIKTVAGEYLGVPIGQECSIQEPLEFNVQLTNKVKFTFVTQAWFGAGLEHFEKRN